jgi:hypothetical protein
MENECTHEWTEFLTCRTCQGIDIEEVEIKTDAPVNDLGWRIKTEPLFGYYCEKCDELTMVGQARHCLLCGKVEWRQTMDEEIFSD